MTEFSESYLDSWQCNLLGLSAEVNVPEFVEPATYAMVDITQTDPDVFTFEYLGNSTERTHLGSELEKLMELKLSKDVEKLRLKNLLEQWMGYLNLHLCLLIHSHSKVKLFYLLSMKLESEKDPKIKQFLKTMDMAKSDLDVLRFWAAAMKRVFMKNLTPS